MFHIRILRKKDLKFYIQIINSYVSKTGIKASAVLDESCVPFISAERAVEYGESMIDAFINAGMKVEPALGLGMEEGGNDEN